MGTSASYRSQPSLDEWLTLPPVQVLRTSEALASHNIHVYVTHLNPTSDYHTGPKTDDDFIVILLNGQNFIESTFKDASGYMPTGSMQVVSRGMEYMARWSASCKSAFIQIPRAVTNDLIATWGIGDPDKVEIPFAFNHRDPLLMHLCQALAANVEGPYPNGLYAEALLHAIAAHLLYEYRKPQAIAPAPGGKMTAQQRRTIEDYINAHIDQNFSMSDLARCVHLSTSHFQKIFRASYQRSPHQYVLERQIEKAKSLMATSHLSLCEIAHACGFANQSHFTRYFSKLVGVSPTRYMGR